MIIDSKAFFPPFSHEKVLILAGDYHLFLSFFKTDDID
jgi:hypothetical protein